ncbi:MAG: LPS export ABC transporter periplasmic protein LptC [Thiobacillus sp.]|nr:LPS export ABC transporter periplasmic protein LptC [Thiobacillus sp.]
MTGGHQVHWLPLGLATLLALLGMWLNQLTHRPVVEDNGGFSHEPDTIVKNFSALAFSVEGKPLHRLSAERLIHYMDDDTTVLESPRFSVLESDRTRSDVTADRGQVSGNGQHVHFLGHVKLTRLDPAADAPTILTTEYLWITPDARIMQTHKPVTLTQGRTVITAGNLLVNDKAKQISLAGGVHGSHQKNR